MGDTEKVIRIEIKTKRGVKNMIVTLPEGKVLDFDLILRNIITDNLTNAQLSRLATMAITKMIERGMDAAKEIAGALKGAKAKDKPKKKKSVRKAA